MVDSQIVTVLALPCISFICIVVILLNAIIKGLVGMKRETNDDSAIADSLHKKEKHMTCHDVFCLRTTNEFLKTRPLTNVLALTLNHLTATYLNFITSLKDSSCDLILYFVLRKEGIWGQVQIQICARILNLYFVDHKDGPC